VEKLARRYNISKEEFEAIRKKVGTA